MFKLVEEFLITKTINSANKYHYIWFGERKKPIVRDNKTTP